MRALQALAAMLIGLTAVGCAALPLANGPAPTPRKSGTIRFIDIAISDVRRVPMLMALDALQAEGYSIQRQYLATSPLVAEALTRGDADIGVLNNQTMWIAINKGSDVRTIMGFVAATTVIISKQEISECRELDGKPVAFPSTTGVNPALLSLYLKQNCAGAAPKFVVVVDNTARDAALVSGQVDAVMTQSEEFLKIDQLAPGKFHVLTPLSQAFPQIQVDGVQARKGWAEQNPETVKDFIRAVLTAYRQVQANPSLLFAESEKRLTLDSHTAEEIGGEYLQFKIWDANGGLTIENVQATIDFLTGVNGLPQGLKAADVADLSYLSAVLAETGRK